MRVGISPWVDAIAPLRNRMDTHWGGGGLVMLGVKLEDAADESDAAAAEDDDNVAADDVDHLHVSVPRSPHERRQSVSAAAS